MTKALPDAERPLQLWLVGPRWRLGGGPPKMPCMTAVPPGRLGVWHPPWKVPEAPECWAARVSVWPVASPRGALTQRFWFRRSGAGGPRVLRVDSPFTPGQEANIPLCVPGAPRGGGGGRGRLPARNVTARPGPLLGGRVLQFPVLPLGSHPWCLEVAPWVVQEYHCLHAQGLLGLPAPPWCEASPGAALGLEERHLRSAQPQMLGTNRKHADLQYPFLENSLHYADENDYAYSSATQSMLSDSWKTSVNICGLIKTPGVWDPFVKSYVEMLEFYGDQDEARKILTNYAYDEKFPSNPNAHVYLYNFLKKEKAPRAKLLSVLKVLYQIVPSHRLMLEFHMLLRKSEKEELHKLGLKVLFGVLDFAGCTKNKTAWKYLARYLRQLLMENRLAWVQEEWNSRKNWWPTFHFSYFWAKTDWKEDTDLTCEKAFVAGILLGKGCRYFRYILKQDHHVLKKKIKRMKKSVKKYSIVNSGV
ncbi:TATA box-binding protein-associated factor RNA polymerase I subunit A-like [Callospermophilus lateralis]|uniref:TATA box-binding protein-associated factor RNA polymerase I subunit A-like n=1 Tax=Callospermophilus lateralis TaxID=76772 RepID=UPI004038ECF6